MSGMWGNSDILRRYVTERRENGDKKDITDDEDVGE